jgi:hypothetical protein
MIQNFSFTFVLHVQIVGQHIALIMEKCSGLSNVIGLIRFFLILCICSCGLIGFMISHFCYFSVIVPIIREEYSCPHVSETKILLLLHIGKSATGP